MKKLMSLAITAMCLVAISTQVQAQEKGEMAAGVQFALGTGDGITNFGIGAKFQWNVIDYLRLEPSFNYFFEKDLVGMWDFSANVHYLFPVAEKLSVYPLAGLGVMGVTVNIPVIDMGIYGSYGGGSASESEFGLNIGGGLDFDLTERFALNVEAKYKIGGAWSRLVASVGVAYKF